MSKNKGKTLVTKIRIESVYVQIKSIIEEARANVVRTVNTEMVRAYWLIGRELVEVEQKGHKRAEYGKQLVELLSQRLSAEFGSGYSVQNLFYMKQFYLNYSRLLSSPKILHAVRGKSESKQNLKIRHTVSDEFQRSLTFQTEKLYAVGGKSIWKPGILHTNLSWTHYRTLLRVEMPEARAFYEVEATKNNWSARELERQINSLLFERLARSRKKKEVFALARRGQEIQTPKDAIKDPFVLEFLNVPETPRLIESKLEEALLNNLQKFLLELGKGFSFVDRQQRLTLDGDHFYVDLVFYHTILKCYVLIDLKVAKLTHGDLGQIQLYVNYYDEHRRTEGDNPTVGLILCTDKNDAVVKYTLGKGNRQIFVSRYKLHLPTEKELVKELRRELAAVRKH